MEVCQHNCGNIDSLYMSVVLKKRRHIAQTRPDLQLGETVINVEKKIELPLFT